MFTQEWLWELLRQVAIAVLTALLGALGYHAAVAGPRLKRLERLFKSLQIDEPREG
ncbi:MAG: hypothetical protein ACYC6L_04760 [Anaerolineae bacterium]